MSQKDTLRNVAEELNCDHKLVLYWKRRYLSEGLAGLEDRSKSGRPRKISRRQESNLKKIIENKPENAQTTKQTSTLIAEKTGIIYSNRHAKRILHRWTFHLTTGRPIYWQRASKEEIEHFGKNLLLQNKISKISFVL